MESSENSYNSPDHVSSQTPTIEVSPAEQLTPQADMTISDGKKKRVGFSSDITPPSPVSARSSTLGSKHHGETVLSPVEADTSPMPTLHPVLPNPDEEPRRFRRPEISDNELARQIHLAMGEPYVPKP